MVFHAVKMTSVVSDLDDYIQKAKECAEFVKKYQWLSETFVLDFFSKNIWETVIPASWSLALSKALPTDLENLLDFENELNGDFWPQEILEMRGKVKSLSIPRSPVTKKDFLQAIECKDDNLSVETWQSFSQEVLHSAGQDKNVENVFKKHVKPKKQHEIARLSDVIRSVANKQNTRYLIDVGSGLGHLSRFLSFGHGFQVVCLDSQNNLSQTARKFDEDLKKAFKNGNRKGPKHKTFHIHSETTSAEFEEAIFCSETPENFGLIGLHTCGDLGPTILKLFLRCPNAKFLISVGCCYMKLEKNFPLSSTVKEIDVRDLGYSSKELACHAIEAYRDRLLNEEELRKHRVHCNRATLEKLIVARYPDKAHTPLRSVANSCDLPFEEYARRATHNTGIHFDDKDFCPEILKESLDKWNHVLAFYVMRLLIAPVIEHLLLLDRLLLLLNSNHESFLLPIFDPKLSPRNHVLLSLKK